MDFTKYGFAISDTQGDLRDISEIISELKEIKVNHSLHAMSDHALFLQGQENALEQVIEYLERV